MRAPARRGCRALVYGRAMALATFKDLCLDAVDRDVVAGFWAAALGSAVQARDAAVASIRDPVLHTLWKNTVPEAKVAKNRVHLDVHSPSPDLLVALGATTFDDQGHFVVLHDPGGNELCVFPGEAGDAVARPFALCVDSPDPVAAATWWQAVLGGRIGPGPDGALRYVHDAAGLGDLVLKFVAVADGRVVKNRCHWDVATPNVDRLVALGAIVVRAEDDDIRWTILADRQGNEFCAFAP
jgi:hypothetical protein